MSDSRDNVNHTKVLHQWDLEGCGAETLIVYSLTGL